MEYEHAVLSMQHGMNMEYETWEDFYVLHMSQRFMSQQEYIMTYTNVIWNNY